MHRLRVRASFSLFLTSCFVSNTFLSPSSGNHLELAHLAHLAPSGVRAVLRGAVLERPLTLHSPLRPGPAVPQL